MTGGPVPAVQGIVSNSGSGSAQFAVTDTGTLVYLHGPSVMTAGIPMQWLDASGKPTMLRAAPLAWSNPAFSPAGDRLAVQILGAQADIWVYDLARETLTAVVVDPAADTRPVWSPDGRDLAFSSARGNDTRTNLFVQRADGTGGAQRLTDAANSQQPTSWHRSGRYLMFEEVNPTTKRDLMILPLEGDDVSGWKPGTPAVLLNTTFDEQQGVFSPDGRWVAYTSNESGRDEVYVRPFPGPGSKWQISTDGGYSPVWSRTRRELFYGAGAANRAERQIMMVPYTAAGDVFTAQKPRRWTEPRFQTRGPNARMFDLHPDGKRFVVAVWEDTTSIGKQNQLTVVFNFFDELRRIAPGAR